MNKNLNLLAAFGAAAAIIIPSAMSIAGSRDLEMKRSDVKPVTLDFSDENVPAYMRFDAQNGIKSLERGISSSQFEGLFFAGENPMPSTTFTLPGMKAPASIQAKAASTTFLTANVVYNGGLGFTQANTMVQMTPTTAASVERIGTSNAYANGGGFYADGKYYTTYLYKNASTGAITSAYNRIYDALTWKQEKSTSILASKGLTTVSIAAAWDATSNKAYGCFRSKDGDALVFASMDKSFNVTEIGTIDGARYWLAAGINAEGQLYALEGNGNLVSVDKATGATTVIGQTGLASGYYTSGTINARTGDFYVAWINQNGTATYLYRIDTTTAQATMIYQLPGAASQLYGMYVADPIADDKAPAKAEQITFDFTNGSLSGKVGFNIPEVSYDGEVASGAVTYAVIENTDTLAKGNSEFGKKVEAAATFKTAGKKTVKVVLTNEFGSSPEVSATSPWIGPDKPSPVTGLKAVVDGDKIILTWNKVSTSLNGGYINAGNMRYNVLQSAPVGKTLSSNQTDTTYTFELPDAETFTNWGFTVAAICDGMVSTGVNANATTGHIVPPYQHNFTSAASLNGYTIIDANNDGKTWSFYNYSAMMGYQNQRPSDDYLITPAVRLEKGKVYTFSFDAKGYQDRWLEKMQVLMGNAPTVEGMNVALSDTITFQNSAYVDYSFTIKADRTGDYYFGIHGMSPNIDENRYLISQAIYVTNVRVSAGSSAQAPKAPEASVVPEKYGKLQATVNITAPVSDFNGDPINSLDSIIVKKGTTFIGRVDAPTPGKNYEVVDNAATSGTNTYSVTAYNSFGASSVTTVAGFIGFTTPKNPTNVTLTEIGNTGEVKVTWDPVTEDINGLIYGEYDIKYTVKNKSGVAVASNITETEVTSVVLSPEDVANGKRTFAQFTVTATSVKGNSAAVATRNIPVGYVSNVPFVENFPNGTLQATPISYAVSQTNMAAVSLCNNETNASIGISSDGSGDNGYLQVKFWGLNVWCRLETAAVNLSNAKAPVYSVMTYACPSSNQPPVQINRTHLICKTVDSDTWSIIGTYEKDAFDTVGWHELKANLDGFLGKTVQLGIITECTGITYSFFDALAVKESPEYDLAVKDIMAPAQIYPGIESNVEVILQNLGKNTAKGYNIDLMLNGANYASIQGPEIMTFGTDTISIPINFSSLDKSELKFQAVVNWEKDLNSANNASGEVTTQLTVKETPAVTNLKAVSNMARTAKLNWSAPASSTIQGVTTDSFESYQAFDVDKAGKWTFIDGDKTLTYGLDQTQLPNIPYTGAYFILDSSNENLNSTFASHSGNNSLACFAANGKTNDDWAISPELCGDAQTVSFYARSYTAQYGNESFEFLYSTSGKETGDFKKLDGCDNVPTDWTEYSYQLPAGAKYFAIRCISSDRFIFMVDDVTFAEAGAEPEILNLTGYNIYRDNNKLNKEVLTGTEYEDTEAEKGDHTYVVTAVYDKYGESKPSNPVTVTIDPDSSSIEDVNAEILSIEGGVQSIKITTSVRTLVSVYSADGKLRTSTDVIGTVNIPVEAGVYVVRAGKASAKVQVR